MNGKLTKEKAVKLLNKIYADTDNSEYCLHSEKLNDLKNRISEIKTEISVLKKELKSLTDSDRLRCMRADAINEKNVIAVFESGVTRALKMQPCIPYNDIIIVQTYYYNVLKSLIKNGFILNNEKYRILTAGAGQIRTKKTVFIKERLWNNIENRLTCGLSVNDINKKGGANVNKYLAYLALQNSATDLWENFDIDKCIVIDDVKTNVNGIVDFIDYYDYSVTRKNADIPINHTDGCGMILPKLSKRNFMIRMPWIKGLLAVFPFDKFIKQNGCSAEIKDIYGKKHNILLENISIIFTKSQFKMWKYYKDWDEYKQNFKMYGYTAGKCNIEEKYFENAKYNYQMMQTLTDITDDEITELCKKNQNKINCISQDRETMLKVFNAAKSNPNKNGFQRSLYRYPAILRDPYTKSMLKNIKNKLVKDALCAKLDINGKYTFIIPDLYAMCEYWFLNNKNPQGLLKNGQVSCKLYGNKCEVDCLRNPHLFKEDAVRENITNNVTSEWFYTNGVYTSCHDLISKILMFDVDGDKSLITTEKAIIQAAKRSCKNVVPLYYDMKKSTEQEINSMTMYEGLTTAYSGGKIGEISNLISKIWNSDERDETLIKILCMENNFVIDYAKTLFKPTRPTEINDNIKSYSSQKLPHFFKYAKDKSDSQILAVNGSPVNRIKSILSVPKFKFDTSQIPKFNYRNLMHNKQISLNTDRAKNITDNWDMLTSRASRNMMRDSENNEKSGNYDFIFININNKMNDICTDRLYLTDVLVKYLFEKKKTSNKLIFWNIFGDDVAENVENNIDDYTVFCAGCGAVIKKKIKNSRLKYCPDCAAKMKHSV